VISELGYESSRQKRNKPPEQGGLIGVLVHFFEGASVYPRLRGIVSWLQPRGFEVVLHIVDSPERARERLMEIPRSRQIDGLVVLSLPLRPDEGERLAEAHFPTVLLDTHHPALPSVTINDRLGGMMSTRHLIDLGHDRIAFVGEPHRNPFGFIASRDREEGYRSAMDAAGLEVPETYVRKGAYLRSAGRQMANELFMLAEPPTAMVCSSDLQAFGVLEAARASGRTVPDDLSIIGFDDVDMASMVGLTTIRQPLEHSGQRAADLMLAALDAQVSAPVGHDPARVTHEELPLDLIARSTTGPAPSLRRRDDRRRPTRPARRKETTS
jgi:DNA-binding LacI/PurR family transcriptional regulator